MFEADLTKTVRRATLDDAVASRVRFARRSIEDARSHQWDTIVWYFHAKDSVKHLAAADARLERVVRELRSTGRYRTQGVEVLLSTKRAAAAGRTFDLPLAAFWPDDIQLLELDSAHRPHLDALLSATWRAPVWLTAFDLDAGEPVGVRDAFSIGDSDQLSPVVVSDELQDVVTYHSAGMTLSTNGIHDSEGPALLRDVRRLVKRGAATSEGVAVAALRAGWWPEKVPALLAKL